MRSWRWQLSECVSHLISVPIILWFEFFISLRRWFFLFCSVQLLVLYGPLAIRFSFRDRIEFLNNRYVYTELLATWNLETISFVIFDSGGAGHLLRHCSPLLMSWSRVKSKITKYCGNRCPEVPTMCWNFLFLLISLTASSMHPHFWINHFFFRVETAGIRSIISCVIENWYIANIKLWMFGVVFFIALRCW